MSQGANKHAWFPTIGDGLPKTIEDCTPEEKKVLEAEGLTSHGGGQPIVGPIVKAKIEDLLQHAK